MNAHFQVSDDDKDFVDAQMAASDSHHPVCRWVLPKRLVLPHMEQSGTDDKSSGMRLSGRVSTIQILLVLFRQELNNITAGLLGRWEPTGQQ